jgi:hypothetical protein
MRVLTIFLLLSASLSPLFAAPSSFTAPAEYSAGVNTFGTPSLPSMLTGDFNHDHHPDIVSVGVAAQSDGTTAAKIAAALGNGNGTFAPPVNTLVVVAQPGAPENAEINALAAADFNSDGHLDVLIELGGAFAKPPTFQIWFGDGTGKFTAGTILPVGQARVVTGDFNGDGKLDIVAAGTAAISFYPGNGDGTFGSPAVTPLTGPAASWPPMLQVSDLNRDGKLDVLADYSAREQTQGPGGVISFLGKGDGTFTQASKTAGLTHGTANSFVVADFNVDGIPDFAENLGDIFPGQLRVYFGNGDGSFQPPVLYPLSINLTPLSMFAADVDNEGCPEILLLYQTALYILPNLGAGQFDKPVLLVAGDAATLATDDFNSDHLLDIATNSSAFTLGSHTSGAVLLGTGGGSFIQPAANATAGLGSSRPDGTFADFNNDGSLDAVTSNGELLLGTGPVGFAAPVQLGVNGQQVVSGDFNGDGKPDVAFSRQNQLNPGVVSIITVLLGNGDGTFGPPAMFTLGHALTSLAVGDFNHDGHLDLVGAAINHQLVLVPGVGNGTFAPEIAFSVTANTPAESFSFSPIAIGDFNGDGYPDVALPEQTGVAILLGAGAAGFSSPGTFMPVAPLNPSNNSNFVSVLAADIDGDHKTDLVVGYADLFSATNTGVLIYPGNGDGSFGSPTPINLLNEPYSLAFADVDGDQVPDLLACGFYGDLGVALGKHNGTFGDAQQFVTGVFCARVFGGQISTAAGVGIATINTDSAFNESPSSGTVSVTEVLPSKKSIMPKPIMPNRRFHR